MLLAGMSGVTALSTTLQAMHENKQLDYATPAAPCPPEFAYQLGRFIVKC